jgi:galactonate dehydratase
VALCAALHFGWSTTQVMIQENFAEYDVPWRNELVCGWNPIRPGEFILPEQPGLGLELNEEACAKHPYQRHTFPSLWDQRWVKQFTASRGNGKGERGA